MLRGKYIACAVALTVGGTLGLAQSKKGDADKGKEVFEQCSVCHNSDSTEKKMGPGLKGLFKLDKMTNGQKPTEANVRAKIDEGGNGMPAYKDILSDEDKDNLIAFLKTL
jgi:cytochrome c